MSSSSRKLESKVKAAKQQEKNDAWDDASATTKALLWASGSARSGRKGIKGVSADYISEVDRRVSKSKRGKKKEGSRGRPKHDDTSFSALGPIPEDASIPPPRHSLRSRTVPMAESRGSMSRDSSPTGSEAPLLRKSVRSAPRSERSRRAPSIAKSVTGDSFDGESYEESSEDDSTVYQYDTAHPIPIQGHDPVYSQAPYPQQYPQQAANYPVSYGGHDGSSSEIKIPAQFAQYITGHSPPSRPSIQLPRTYQRSDPPEEVYGGGAYGGPPLPAPDSRSMSLPMRPASTSRRLQAPPSVRSASVAPSERTHTTKTSRHLQ